MHVLSQVKQHHGKQISYNNLLDLDARAPIVRDFEVPACAIVKHNNPCGVALGARARGLRAGLRVRPAERLRRRHRAQPPRRPRDAPSALAEQFIEVLIAPGYDDDALEILTQKQNIRILEDEERRAAALGEPDDPQVTGGLLVQDRDQRPDERAEMEVVTERRRPRRSGATCSSPGGSAST